LIQSCNSLAACFLKAYSYRNRSYIIVSILTLVFHFSSSFIVEPQFSEG
ncbi:Uncharacterized protein APZ42_005508, partial [Daphnia magna]